MSNLAQDRNARIGRLMRQRDEAEAANADLDEANAQLEGKLEAAWAQRDEAKAKLAKVEQEIRNAVARGNDRVMLPDLLRALGYDEKAIWKAIGAS